MPSISELRCAGTGPRVALTLSRSRAQRALTVPDLEGRVTMFGQAFRQLGCGMPPSRLRVHGQVLCAAPARGLRACEQRRSSRCTRRPWRVSDRRMLVGRTETHSLHTLPSLCRRVCLFSCGARTLPEGLAAAAICELLVLSVSLMCLCDVGRGQMGAIACGDIAVGAADVRVCGEADGHCTPQQRVLELMPATACVEGHRRPGASRAFLGGCDLMSTWCERRRFAMTCASSTPRRAPSWNTFAASDRG